MDEPRGRTQDRRVLVRARAKGETSHELVGAAVAAMRDRAPPLALSPPPPSPPRGNRSIYMRTGGDGAARSTSRRRRRVIAACGGSVAKTGNRALSVALADRGRRARCDSIRSTPRRRWYALNRALTDGFAFRPRVSRRDNGKQDGLAPGQLFIGFARDPNDLNLLLGTMIEPGANGDPPGSSGVTTGGVRAGTPARSVRSGAVPAVVHGHDGLDEIAVRGRQVAIWDDGSVTYVTLTPRSFATTIRFDRGVAGGGRALKAAILKKVLAWNQVGNGEALERLLHAAATTAQALASS